MDMYLIDELKKYTFHFPVNPLDKINIEKQKRIVTVDIMDIGEADIVQKGENIDSIEISTLFPKEFEPFCRYSPIPTPEVCMNLMEYYRSIDQPIRLIITDLNINTLVTLYKYKTEDKSGEVGDKYIDITFRTCKEIKIDTVLAIEKSTLKNNRQDTQTSYFNAGDNVKVTASELNVRNGPGMDYDVIGSVGNGKTLEIYRVEGNWADVYWGNHGGFISLDYVEKV